VSTSGAGATVYLGYDLLRYLSVEAGYTYRDPVEATLHGVASSAGDESALLADTVKTLRGFGNIYTLALRSKYEFAPRWSIEPRVGVILVESKSTAEVDSLSASARHNDVGWTAGGGVAWRAWRALKLGLGADYFRISGDRYATLYGISIEWRFGQQHGAD
jgi:opacity protein-like surface antigen